MYWICIGMILVCWCLLPRLVRDSWQVYGLDSIFAFSCRQNTSWRENRLDRESEKYKTWCATRQWFPISRSTEGTESRSPALDLLKFKRIIFLKLVFAYPRSCEWETVSLIKLQQGDWKRVSTVTDNHTCQRTSNRAHGQYNLRTGQPCHRESKQPREGSLIDSATVGHRVRAYQHHTQKLDRTNWTLACVWESCNLGLYRFWTC